MKNLLFAILFTSLLFGPAFAGEARWNEVYEVHAAHLNGRLQKTQAAGNFKPGQYKVARHLSVSIPLCAKAALKDGQWIGYNEGEKAFATEERRCFLRVFLEQLDREDWKAAEKINTITKKFAPHLAMAGVDDRE